MRAVIFDVDGVLIESPHERAWSEALRTLMEGSWADIRESTTWSPESFTPRLYQQSMSGRPRADGAKAALDHFLVPDATKLVDQYSACKQLIYERMVHAGEVNPYPDAMRFLFAAKRAELTVGVASSSTNASWVLNSIHLEELRDSIRDWPSTVPAKTLLQLFDSDVSGSRVERGKPHPDLYLVAAAELGVRSADVVVIEDAASGVEAAKAGAMCVIGLARADDADLLASAGADLVVNSLDEVDLESLVVSGQVLARSP